MLNLIRAAIAPRPPGCHLLHIGWLRLSFCVFREPATARVTPPRHAATGEA